MSNCCFAVLVKQCFKLISCDFLLPICCINFFRFTSLFRCPLLRFRRCILLFHSLYRLCVFYRSGCLRRPGLLCTCLRLFLRHGFRLFWDACLRSALLCGFKEAQGDVVITMDADLQDSPDEIPELYRMIKEDGYDLVSGYKQKRYDPLSKTLPTKLFNATARKISGIHNLHDFNCGLKAYRRDVIKNIEVYGEMHRYIPYLAKNAGFDKIGEKVVHHQARKYGKSKFGLNRFFNGYLDLITLWFLSNFGKKPMHVFGFMGTMMFIIGFISAFIIGADKLWCLSQGIPQRLVTDSPYFFIALTMMMIGTQLFLAGFIGDLVSRSSQNRNDYQIEKTLKCVKQ